VRKASYRGKKKHKKEVFKNGGFTIAKLLSEKEIVKAALCAFLDIFNYVFF
jgi:hypothetical protein